MISALYGLLASLLLLAFGSVVVRWLVPNLSSGATLGLGVLIGVSGLGLSALGFGSVGLDARWAVVIWFGAVLVGLISGWASIGWPVIDRELLVRAIGIGVLGINGISLPTTFLGVLLLLLPQAGFVCVDRVTLRRVVTVAVIVVGSASTVLLSIVQPSWRFSDSNDVPFFEALSGTLTHFGLDSHPGFLGGDVRGYHVLAYLWPGVLTDLTGAPPFVMLCLVMPFLAAMSLALLLLSNSKAREPGSWVQPLLVAGLVWVFGRGVVSSASFGSWALIAYVVVLLQIEWQSTNTLGSRVILRREILLGILGITAVLGKGPSLGVVGLLSVTPLIHHVFIDTPRDIRRIARNLPFHLPVVMISTAVWYAPADDILKTRDPSPLSSITNSGINEGLWASRDLLEYTPLLLLLGLVAAYALVWPNKTTHLTQSLILLMITCFGTTAAVWLLPERTVRANLTQHAFYVSLAILVITVTKTSWRTDTTRKLLITAISTTPLAGILAIYFSYYLNDHLGTKPWFTANRWIPELLNASRGPLMLLVPLTITSLVLRQKKQTQPHYIAIPIIASTFILTTTLSVLTFRFDSIQSTIDSANKPQPAPWAAAVPDQDTFEVGEWIQNNTPTTAILASNSFCCWNDETWLSRAGQQLQSPGTSATSFGEDGFGGSNYLLASVTSRRFLVAGPRFAVALGIPGSAIQERLLLSVDYGLDQSADLKRNLRVLGVSFYIFDKKASSNIDSQLTRLFENERYVVIAL